MISGRLQKTIDGRSSVAGFGYWSGKDVRLEFRPAGPGAGITFVRSDLGPMARVPAAVEHRAECPRRTNLRRGQVQVEMVEHVLAALSGMEVDNCEIRVDGVTIVVPVRSAARGAIVNLTLDCTTERWYA